MKKIVMVWIAVLLMITGCANKEGGKKDDLVLMERTNPKPMDVIYGMDHDDYGKENPNEGLITDVKKTVAKHEEIYDVIVVKKDKDILVAYKVKHMKRFHMKKIEKKVKKQLKDKYPDFHFIVSSDYKIFLELFRLNEMLKAKDVPEKKAKKKYEEIISLHEELT
ncbi:YhcN/YlaJ family sporulation lipoprotein [Peribacillus asahii]|uniref:Sporulation protein n=1 Tax=Peribacillus asahii TaxID=228899 RepID=A0A3Q9RL71_9BACI|nr:YhcN/YlaJ family sporulation lipoprotein [Peribacillus asahii]AZV41792.1 sporulation protein [Peribacillus asahii]USK86129.1 YhcN/YlaJ family sporulation lipoprotein [Peribacillus asahii]